jgi:hypothetical protein
LHCLLRFGRSELRLDFRTDESGWQSRTLRLPSYRRMRFGRTGKLPTRDGSFKEFRQSLAVPAQSE